MKLIFKIIKWILIAVIVGGLLWTGLIVWEGKSMYDDMTAEKSIADRVAEQQANSDYVTLDRISGEFLNAVVSVEDRNFYSHGAVNPSSMVRALITNIKEKSFKEGGSTITQQLAKNLCFSQEKKLSRKVAEVIAAIELENEYSKDQILELYVNLNYYGDGYYGVGPASIGYFGKEPAYMTSSEATMLAGLPQAPSAYALSTNADKAYARQKEVVDSMVDNKYITQEEANSILEESAAMHLTGSSHPNSVTGTSGAIYLSDTQGWTGQDTDVYQ